MISLGSKPTSFGRQILLLEKLRLDKARWSEEGALRKRSGGLSVTAPRRYPVTCTRGHLNHHYLNCEMSGHVSVSTKEAGRTRAFLQAE